MAKSGQDLVTMLRNVTGRIDKSDPLFTDQIMLGYLNDFLSLDSTQDIRIFQNRTWWEFTYGPANDDPFPVDLQALGFSTIGPPAYVDGFYAFWYQDPANFYAIWPETQTYQPQRPTYILYYNNELTFRGPPEREYTVKIAAYEVQVQIANLGANINTDYLYRYAVYGAALNVFSDYGEMDRWNEIFPVFKRYRALVYARTAAQYQNQRPNPEF